MAPDGRGFSDRSEYRKYMFETFYSFRGLCQPGSTHTKPPGSIAGQPFSIADCAGTTLRLCDWSETVHIDRCSATRVLVAASCESVFLRNLTDCTITVACKQLRVRDCTRCTVYLSAKTEPVIEASSGMVFAPYNCALGGLPGAFAAAALEPGVNHWDKVFDFSKDDAALPTPHWSTQGACDRCSVCVAGYLARAHSLALLPCRPTPRFFFSLAEPGQWEAWVIDEFGPAVNPVPRDARAPRGAEGSGSGNVGQSFSIRTGQAAAQAAVEEAQE